MIDKIDIPIYNTSVYILVEVTENEIKDFYANNLDKLTYEEYKMLTDDLDNEKIEGSTMNVDKGGYTLYLRNGKADNFVSHEIFHVCNRILLDRGVQIDNSAEPWAFLIGWFTEEYYRRYWEYHDKKKENEVQTGKENMESKRE